MAKKRRRRSTKSIPLVIGNDPNMWRFDSLHEALENSTEILAQLIRSQTQATEQEPEMPTVAEAEPFDIAAR